MLAKKRIAKGGEPCAGARGVLEPSSSPSRRRRHKGALEGPVPMTGSSNSRSQKGRVVIRSHLEEMKKKDKATNFSLAQIDGSCNTFSYNWL